MPTLSFEGETHGEIVRKVKRWLASLDGEESPLGPVEAVEAASELTKDALSVIARAAPGPVAKSDLMKALTRMGYETTETTKKAVIAGLDSIEQATEGSTLKRVRQARNAAAYEMSTAVARQLLKSLNK